MIASSNINLKADLSNAVQSIEKVIFLKDILSNVGSGVILTNSWNFVKIDTRVWDKDKNIIIEWNGTFANNVDEYNSKGSHILWWEWNHINGSYDTIIWWLQNKISSGDYSTIWWWNHNIITWNYNVIAWWSGNKIIGGDYSSIPGGENNKIEWSYSVALWVNNVVSGDYSVALWSWSKVIADRSFLWTDGNQEWELRANDVFAIVSKSGMAINTATPHDFAKLTVSWSLVIEGWDELECSEDTKWTIVARGGEQVCLYSCDWSWRNSLYKGRCPSPKIEPSKCGVVNKICNADGSFYSWSCINGKVIEWTWSYFVDKDDKVHRTCQSEDWNLTECSKAVSNTYGDCPNGEYECDLSLIDHDSSKLDNILVSGVDWPLWWRFQKNFSDDIVTAEILESSDTIDGLPCKWKCKDWYKVTLWSNWYYCTERWCLGVTINSYQFPEANHNEVKQSTNEKLTKPWNDWEKKCRWEALCNVSDYIFSGENCTYTCWDDSRIYSWYTYTATFQSWTYVTWTRTMNSGWIDYTCSIRLECLYDSIINLSWDEVCVPDGCEATTYTTWGHTYNIPSASVWSYRAYYTGSECVYNLPYQCKSNSERWFWSESRNCSCPPGMERDDTLWMCVNSDSSCSAVDMRGCDDWDSVNTGSCLDGLCIWQCVKNWVNVSDWANAQNWGVKNDGQKWCWLCEDGSSLDTSDLHNGGCSCEKHICPDGYELDENDMCKARIRACMVPYKNFYTSYYDTPCQYDTCFNEDVVSWQAWDHECQWPATIRYKEWYRKKDPLDLENESYILDNHFWYIINEIPEGCTATRFGDQNGRDIWYYLDCDFERVDPIVENHCGECHHCAINWFPYCFPINFSPVCNE